VITATDNLASGLTVAGFIVLGGGIMSWVAWTARTLYQHAQIIAGLVPMPAKIDKIAEDVVEIKVEQARLSGQLAGRHTA
jgi:hypothetical protein